MTSRLHSFIASLLISWVTFVLAAAAVRAALPPERDIWYSISDGEQRYGSVHVVVRHVEDGNVSYTVTSHLKVELFGTRQEFATKSTAIVMPDLSPLRMESEVQGMTGVALVRGEMRAEGLVIETKQDGQVSTSTYSFDDDLGLDFTLSIGDRLHRIAKGMDASAQEADLFFTRRVRLLAVESGTPTEATVRLTERGADGGSTWTLEPEGQEWAESTFRFDGEGIMIEQISAVPRMHVVRSTREEAMDFGYRVIPNRELLVFPLDRELPSARHLQWIDVDLSWQNISHEAFNLEDSRQKLLSLTQDGDRYTARVRLMRPSGDRVELSLPVSAEMFEATLAETTFIQPGDPRIVAIAREIVGDETSARAAAEAISQWVIEFIHSDTVMDTQPLRWKLTESLDVSVADFERVPGAADVLRDDGLKGTTYTSTEFGIRFDLPDERWTLTDHSSPGALLLRLHPPNEGLAEPLGDALMIHVTAFTIPSGMPARAVINARLNHNRSQLTEFELLLDEPTELGGASGHHIRFQGTPPGDHAVPLRVTELLAINGTSGVLVNMIATKELHERFLERFERMGGSVVFLGE